MTWKFTWHNVGIRSVFPTVTERAEQGVQSPSRIVKACLPR